MRITFVSMALASALSIVTASELHRVKIERVKRSGSDNTRQHVQRTLAKYSTRPRSRIWGQREQQQQRQGYSSKQKRDQRQRTEDSDGQDDKDDAVDDTFRGTGSRRSRQIDAARVPIEYNPSEVAFVGQVGIGTPNQYFNLEFDIGSADTWVTVAHANCSRNKPCPAQRRAFFPERSTTFEATPALPWNLDFNDGVVVNGTLSTDVVQVAGFVVDRQAIGLASSFKGAKDNGIDGSFGLGPRQLTFHNDPTPIDNLIQTGRMRSEVGVWLGAGNQGGELIFGGRDRGRYYGELSYYNVPKGSAYWSTPVESVTVVSNQPRDDGSGFSTFRTDQIESRIGDSTKRPMAIFDTSTDLIMLPPRVAEQVHQHIHNYFFGLYSGYSLIFGLYTVSCSLGDMETDIWIDLGPPVPMVPDVAPSPSPPKSKSSTVGQRLQGSNSSHTSAASPPPRHPASPPSGPIFKQTPFTTERLDGPQRMRYRISGRDIVRERIPVFGGLMNVCFSGIQASKKEDDDWVFGNIWFMNNYVTLDHHHRQVGIAAAVQS